MAFFVAPKYETSAIMKKKFKSFLDSRHQQNAFPKLKSYIKLPYPKTTFVEGHLLKKMKRWVLGE